VLSRGPGAARMRLSGETMDELISNIREAIAGWLPPTFPTTPQADPSAFSTSPGRPSMRIEKNSTAVISST